VEAASIEEIWQDYKNFEFITIGVDTYDGERRQVEPFWGNITTFPVLLKGSGVANEYGLVTQSVAIIDHEGRMTGRFWGGLQLPKIRATVAEAVANLPALQAEPPTAVEVRSWGNLKEDRREIK
jgi:hypothetical protein